MKRLALPLILALLLPACASVPVKEKAVQGLQSTHAVLAAAQDGERLLCNPVLAAAQPPKPILSCDGPAAQRVGLTDARHHAAATAFVAAFDAEVKASAALSAWHAGDPVPTTLSELVAQTKRALAVVRELTADPKVTKLAGQIQVAIDNVTQLVDALNHAKK